MSRADRRVWKGDTLVCRYTDADGEHTDIPVTVHAVFSPINLVIMHGPDSRPFGVPIDELERDNIYPMEGRRR
jgi:hypothetical protein